MSHVPMTRPDEMLAMFEQAYGHSVSFCRLEDGRILMVADGGEFCVSPDGGITWGTPYRGRIAGAEDLPFHNPSLVKLAGKTIGIAFLRRRLQLTNSPLRSTMVFMTSEDEGHTWSDPVEMNRNLLPAHACQDSFVRTSSGRLILPVYFEVGKGTWHQKGSPFVGAYLGGNFISVDAHFFDAHFGASYVLYSDDDGRSWQANQDGELLIWQEPAGAFYPTFEPSVCEVSPGFLLMIMRTSLGRLFQAWSKDNGQTWCPPVPTQLAGTQAPGQLRRLPNGHLLCVWTQQSEEEIKQGFVRTRLSSAVSRNRGGIWEFFQNIESLHEQTRVEPAPIRPIRPEGRGSGGLGPGLENDARYIVELPQGYGRWCYPSVLVTEDRVLISYMRLVNDPKTAESLPPCGSRLKVLPITWFYGGREPFESPVVAKIAGQVTPP